MPMELWSNSKFPPPNPGANVGREIRAPVLPAMVPQGETPNPLSWSILFNLLLPLPSSWVFFSLSSIPSSSIHRTLEK